MNMYKELVISNQDIKLYNLSMRVALKSNCTDKHGTVIVRGGSVISQAANRLIDHPMSRKFYKRSIHSEQRALIRCQSSTIGATLYTSRLNNLNPCSKPCNMCSFLIAEAGIDKIVYHNGSNLVKVRIQYV